MSNTGRSKTIGASEISGMRFTIVVINTTISHITIVMHKCQHIPFLFHLTSVELQHIPSHTNSFNPFLMFPQSFKLRHFFKDNRMLKSPVDSYSVTRTIDWII